MATPRDYKWKYRNENPLERLHPGEPYWLTRAQDSLASEHVSAYSDLLKRESDKARAAGDDALADDLLKQAIAVTSMAREFMDWQDDNPGLVKKPRVR